MKQNKVLSIVIPTYNVEKYLDRCLLSLSYDSEALSKIEVIVVNDGSKDSSVEVAKKYEKIHPKSIQVIDKENGGHGSTINTGLKIAKGTYFRVIDSDDWVNIDDFGNFVRQLETLDSDMIITNYSREYAYDGTKQLCVYKSLEYGKSYNLDEMDLSLFGDDYLYMATTTIKTEKLRKANLELDEHTFYVDMEYNILPIQELSTFIYLDFDIYRYWIGRPEQSMDIQNMLKNRHHHEKVLHRIIDFHATANLSRNKKQYIEKIITLMINSHYFMYCSRRTSKETLSEIKAFDKWLQATSSELYVDVAKKFPYIDHLRKTGFAFTKTLPRTFMRVSDRVTKRQLGDRS